jgi:hypothetical protein
MFLWWVSPVNRDLTAISHLDDVSSVVDLNFSILGKVYMPQLL